MLILFDHDENALYHIHMELNENRHNATALIPVVSDIKCKAHLETLFEQYRPQVVFHAAAHKHVPLMENNVREVVENNIGGTCNLLKMAVKYNVKDFVFISTDKAVRPTNCMGATKRMGEVMLQIQSAKKKTKFSAVRFGNVLGSQGSVIPLFRRQIAEGGPITITHPDITRYFMTIPEAVSLVVQTGALSQGGEIFILDMGEPVTIMSLAQDLIRLSGLEEGKDIDIKVTGLRPGEKMFEELFFDKSNLTETPNKKIFVTEPYVHDENAVMAQIETLVALCQTGSDQEVRNSLFALVKQTEPQTKEEKE
jgi:FlaA1/EpsC-like NDP-sugar epimerase